MLSAFAKGLPIPVPFCLFFEIVFCSWFPSAFSFFTLRFSFVFSKVPWKGQGDPGRNVGNNKKKNSSVGAAGEIKKLNDGPARTQWIVQNLWYLTSLDLFCADSWPECQTESIAIEEIGGAWWRGIMSRKYVSDVGQDWSRLHEECTTRRVHIWSA